MIETRVASWKKKYLNAEDDQRISYLLQPLEEIHTETIYGSSPGGYTMSKRILQALAFVGIFILTDCHCQFYKPGNCKIYRTR
jgi:putative ABC transport system permease protein